MKLQDIFGVEELQKMEEFISAAYDACTEMDKEIPFTCPVCGGNATAYQTSYNGHRHGHCTGCGLDFRE